jgi:hypothetical protein
MTSFTVITNRISFFSSSHMLPGPLYHQWRAMSCWRVAPRCFVRPKLNDLCSCDYLCMSRCSGDSAWVQTYVQTKKDHSHDKRPGQHNLQILLEEHRSEQEYGDGHYTYTYHVKCYIGFCTPRRTEMDPKQKRPSKDDRPIAGCLASEAVIVNDCCC